MNNLNFVFAFTTLPMKFIEKVVMKNLGESEFQPKYTF